MARVFGVICVAMFVAAAGCGDSGGNESDNPFEGFESELYADIQNWLCHPELGDNDLCTNDLDSTIVNADGSLETVPHSVASDTAFDCFYVYPTASADLGTGNSDLVPGAEEIFTVRNQAARYSEACRVFAPMYRQVTLLALFNSDLSPDRELAYGDVLVAFKHYMGNYNNGRPILLIGHSQGSGHLARLVAEVIEAEPVLHERLIAAHLLGTTIAVPIGEDVGGSFQITPVCRVADESGCVVTYASFRDTNPPGDDSLFARTGDEDTEAACSNPAALGGGSALTTPYFPITLNGGLLTNVLEDSTGPFANPADADMVTTPFYITPGFLEAECVNTGDFNYLSVRTLADPEDPRADGFSGEFTSGWGLHIVDMTIAMGDLVTLSQNQAQAWSEGN